MPESNLFNFYNCRCLDHPENELQKRENLDNAIKFLTTVEKVPHMCMYMCVHKVTESKEVRRRAVGGGG